MFRVSRYWGFLVLALAMPSWAFAGDAHWRVVETSGQVELSSASGFAPVSVSNDVNPGSVLRTGANGRAVIENNGDRITVAPNSVFELPAQDNGAMEQVKQSVGTALYDMVPRGVDRFRVETPYLAALIKGTVFTVAVTPQGAAVEVLRGVVQVTDSANQSPTLVYPGQTATVAASEHGEVHLLGKPPASAPKSNAPASPAQPTGGKSATAAIDGAGTHQGEQAAAGLHIDHVIGPKTIAIGDLTKGLITHVDVDHQANGGNGKGNGSDGPALQTASLADGFSSGGGDLSGFGGASGNGLSNVSLGVGGSGLSSGSNAGGNGNGNALGLGGSVSGLGNSVASSGIANPAGIVNPGNGIGNGGIPPGLVNQGNGTSNSQGNNAGGNSNSPGNNAGGNGNGNGGSGNGNGKGNQKH